MAPSCSRVTSLPLPTFSPHRSHGSYDSLLEHRQQGLPTCCVDYFYTLDCCTSRDVDFTASSSRTNASPVHFSSGPMMPCGVLSVLRALQSKRSSGLRGITTAAYWCVVNGEHFRPVIIPIATCRRAIFIETYLGRRKRGGGGLNWCQHLLRFRISVHAYEPVGIGCLSKTLASRGSQLHIPLWTFFSIMKHASVTSTAQVHSPCVMRDEHMTPSLRHASYEIAFPEKPLLTPIYSESS